MTSPRILLGAMRRSLLVAPYASGFVPLGHSWRRSVPIFARTFSSLPDHKLITMPRLSPTMEVGTVQEWKITPGEAISAGDTLAEIETDKATRSFEYQDDGFLAKIFVQEGEPDIPVGANLCIIVENKDDIEAFEKYEPVSTKGKQQKVEDPPSAAAPTPPVAVPAPAPVTPHSTAQAVHATPALTPAGGRILASPMARRAAADAGIDLTAMAGAGTGPHGRVIVADVVEAVKAGSVVGVSQPISAISAIEGAHTDVDATKFQRVAAERLVLSKQTIPHYYLTTECLVDLMLALRADLNAKAGEKGSKLSVNDFVIKAAAAALRRVPEVNAQWLGNVIRKFHAADISVAVQTPSGLITPIVKDADRKGIRDISAEVKLLAERAREGRLAPEEFMGGTFTISNLGMYGVSEFAAIINPPQAAILAVGTSVQRVVPDTGTESGFGVRTIMAVTLSCDHRVIDGAVGAEWLAAFRACLENPVEMIL